MIYIELTAWRKSNTHIWNIDLLSHNWNILQCYDWNNVFFLRDIKADMFIITAVMNNTDTTWAINLIEGFYFADEISVLRCSQMCKK